MGVEMRAPVFEARAQLAVARARVARGGTERERVAAAVSRCEQIIATTGAHRFTPDVRDLRAASN